MLRVTAIVLTFNEELHLARCIASLREVASDILVVDCGSRDGTVSIARALGAKVVYHEWLNYATQFNWALEQLAPDTDWVLRIDADEILTHTLRDEIRSELPRLSASVEGVHFNRTMTFQGRLIRFGGVFPVHVLRLFRRGKGVCETRWMDEHIKVSGPVVTFRGSIIDDNLNSLTWWTDKHNKYASREAVDMLNLEFRFSPLNSVASLHVGGEPAIKRWIKENLYSRLPIGSRAFLYFVYRYFLRLGFLDGRQGASFHFLQAFWYRYLVDAKIYEVKRRMAQSGASIETAIAEVLNIRV
jgi:glycosyltransferase involved in cell wall biosynthesis